MALQPARVVEELRELQALTGDEHGAHRVCWTATWGTAREWLKAKLAELPVEVEVDAAGNLWATLRGRDPRAVVIGSHLDSVYGGGWLDGALGVVAALEVLRRHADSADGPPLTIRLVDWADEEGVRFGRSLLGSSAVSGTLDLAELDGLQDRDGISIQSALADHGVAADRMPAARGQLEGAVACIELHIEQGKVLEQAGLSLGVVPGTCGAERHAIRFRGKSDIGCATPMAGRRDAFLAGARFGLEVRDIARAEAGVTTVGACVLHPGTSTAIAERCELLMEQNHFDGPALERMVRDAKAAGHRIAALEGTPVEFEPLWRIDPLAFDPDFTVLADEVVTRVAGTSMRVPSAPLHDAAEVQRAGVPCTMLFVRSIDGISHHRDEDTTPEDLELSVVAFDALTDAVMLRIASA